MVHGNAQELLDHRCHAWCGPSIGGESKLAGTAIQPREHQLDLLGIERCPTTTAWLGLQTRFSAIAKAFSPASDAASADAKKVGDKLLAPSLGEPEHCQQTQLFRPMCRPWQRGHGRDYPGWTEKRTLLF
jgi:hypothetical protein